VSRKVRAGLGSEITGGNARIVTLSPTPRGLPRTAIVVRDAGGILRGYLNLCKHILIPLDGGSGSVFDPTKTMLQCGTHGATYRLDDGYCTAGPCEGESLDPLELVHDSDGTVYVIDVETV